MKVKNKGRQSLLEKFPNEQDFQQQQPSLPVTLDNLSQKKNNLAIQQQPQLALHNDCRCLTYIITAIKIYNSSKETFYKICESRNHYLATTNMYLLEPIQEKIHYLHQNIHPLHIHTSDYLSDETSSLTYSHPPDMPADEPI